MTAMRARASASRLPLLRLAPACRRFRDETDGAVMVETLLILPVIIVLLAGILEFGSVLFKKVELEAGLRDAARYVARCQDYVTGASVYGCSIDAARNIAVYGDPSGSGGARVQGLAPENIYIPPDRVYQGKQGNTFLYSGGKDVRVIRLEATFDYPGGPLLRLLGLPLVRMSAFHEEVVVGW